MQRSVAGVGTAEGTRHADEDRREVAGDPEEQVRVQIFSTPVRVAVSCHVGLSHSRRRGGDQCGALVRVGVTVLL